MSQTKEALSEKQRLLKINAFWAQPPSLQAAVVLPLKPEHELLLTDDQWAEIAIASNVTIDSDPDEPLEDVFDELGDDGVLIRAVLGAARPLPWSPWPGHHVLELVDAKGAVLDAVSFDVRGAQARDAASHGNAKTGRMPTKPIS